MKVGKQIRIVSYCTPEAVENLHRLSAATRITKAVLLREGQPLVNVQWLAGLTSITPLA